MCQFQVKSQKQDIEEHLQSRGCMMVGGAAEAADACQDDVDLVRFVHVKCLQGDVIVFLNSQAAGTSFVWRGNALHVWCGRDCWVGLPAMPGWKG